MLSVSVVDWILKNYPEEAPFLEEADHTKSFADLWACLDRHECVYDFLGITDSFDREYAFQGLVEALNQEGFKVDYDDVFLTWIDKRDSVVEKEAK